MKDLSKLVSEIEDITEAKKIKAKAAPKAPHGPKAPHAPKAKEGGKSDKGEKLVAEIRRLAALRDKGKLNRSDIEAANEAIGKGEIELQSDGNKGFIVQFGMMPDNIRKK
jgi:hypothetical protein